jgi:hypothetical protein
MKADKDLDTVDFRVVACSSTYTYSATHDFYNDLSGVISDIVAATGEAVADVTGGGNFDTADVTITNVTGTCTQVIGFDYTGGADSARALLVHYDTATGLPTGALSAGSIPVTVNASGWFSFTTP